MESPIEFIRSIRDTVPTPVSHFGEQVILSVVSKIENIWNTYVLKIGRHMITVACLSVAVVIFIASRFFRQNRIQPPNIPNPATQNNNPIPITQTDQNPPVIPTPDIPRLRFEANPIPLPKQTAPSNIQPPDPNAHTIPDPNPLHPPPEITDRQENPLAIIPFYGPTTPTIRVHLPTTKASSVPHIFRRSTEEESAIIPVSQALFNRKISIIVSRDRFKVTFIKYGRREQDEIFHPDQQAQIERVMHEIEELSSTIFPKGFGPIRLPLKNPPRDFEPYCMLLIQNLKVPALLEILPPKDAPTPLFLPIPTFDFQSYQHLPPSFMQLNLLRRLVIHREPQDQQQPLATSPTNIETTPLSKATQTDLFPIEITTASDEIKLGNERIEESTGEDLTKLRKALEKAHKQITELFEQISKREEENKELADSLREAIEEQNRLSTGCTNAWELLDKETEKNATIKRELAASRIEVKMLVEEKAGVLKEHLNRLQQESASHELTKQKLRQSEALISEKEAQLEQVKQQLTQAKAAEAETSTEYEKYRREAEAHLQEIFEENTALSRKNTALEEENAQLRLLISSAKEENTALAAKYAELQSLITDTHQENTALEEENEKLRSSIRDAHEMKKNAQQLGYSAIFETSVELSEGIKKSETTEQSNTQQLEKFRNALERAHEEITTLKEQMSTDAQEKKQLQSSLEEAHKEIKRLGTDLSQQNTLIDSLEARIEKTEEDNTDLTRQNKLLSEQQGETKQLQSQLTRLREEADANELRLQRFEEIQASLDQKEAELERIKQELGRAQTAHQILDSKFTDYMAESESLLQSLENERIAVYLENARLCEQMARLSRTMASSPRRPAIRDRPPAYTPNTSFQNPSSAASPADLSQNDPENTSFQNPSDIAPAADMSFGATGDDDEDDQ